MYLIKYFIEIYYYISYYRTITLLKNEKNEGKNKKKINNITKCYENNKKN